MTSRIGGIARYRVIVSVAAFGLMATWGAAAKPPRDALIHAQELEPRMAQFYANFVNMVSSATDRERAEDADVAQLRRLALAKLGAMRSCRATVFQNDPRNALVDTWGLCIRLRLLLEGDDGRERFGPETEAMLQGVLRSLEEIEGIAAEFLTAEQIASATQALEEYFTTHAAPEAAVIKPPSANELQAGAGLGWLFRLPLAPFRAMEGGDNTAEALGSMNITANNLTQIAASLPMEISWQSELLLLQAREDSGAMLQELVDALDVRLRGLINLIFWRTLMVVGAILLAVLVLQSVASRRRRSAAGAK